MLTPGETLLPPGAEPPVAETMGSYGRVLRTEAVVERTNSDVDPFAGGIFSNENRFGDGRDGDYLR